MAKVADGERTLEYTPTWALATVSTIFIVISLIFERGLHAFGHYLIRTKRKSLNLALQKLKDELMLMGFISLTITIFSTPISKICVKSSAFNSWTPCNINSRPQATAYAPAGQRRRLLAAAKASYCDAGYEPFVSYNTLHQLHIFIFVLTCVHVTYTCLTMVLSLTKVYTWGKWEREAHEAVAQQNTAEFTENIDLSRQSTFVRYHGSKPMGLKLLVWVECLFKQFYVPRADYLTLRLSFVTAHSLQDNYDFHSYMVRCVEDEFETIVGISLYQWGFVIVYLLFSIAEPYAHFWTAMIPLAVVLIIGTKLQYVIATLALEHSGVKGPFVGVLLKPRDQLFWFNRPRLILHIIHFIFFESAFELAMFIWHIWQFNFKTCLLDENKALLYIRLSIGVVTQIVCCFATFPLYSLVSQMSTMPKKAFMPKTVERGLKKWHDESKRRLKIKVLEKYQTDRLAKRREGANVTPLDQRYFLEGSNNNSEVLAITDRSHHSGRTTPMALIMEEGSLHNHQGSASATSNPSSSSIYEIIPEAAAPHPHPHPHHQAHKMDRKSTFRMSPRFKKGSKAAVELIMHSHANDSMRRRGPPKSSMNLHVPPNQPQEGTTSATSPKFDTIELTPRPPVQRSHTVK